MCVLSWVSLMLSKSRKLLVTALMEFFILCCLMKPSGSKLRHSRPHTDSAEAMMSDSFGRVAKLCYKPKRRTCSSSAVSG